MTASARRFFQLRPEDVFSSGQRKHAGTTDSTYFSNALWKPHQVFVLSLARRADRLERFNKNFRSTNWPFQEPRLFRAIDGESNLQPKGWRHSRGAWGCLRSHEAILAEILQRGAESALIMEDDAEFPINFGLQFRQFLQNVPDDWEGLMIGGDHEGHQPERICDGVVRCQYTVRIHCYALRGPVIRRLLEAYHYANDHVDRILANFMKKHYFYAPDPFLVSQAPGQSDVDGKNWMVSRFGSNA